MPRPRPAGGGYRPALVLAVLGPLVAEVTLGSVPVAMAWVILLYVPMYGAGVVLVRELVRRSGGGWGSLLLLGVAYGLVEEGFALQSLTSPHLFGAAGWAPRVLGINTAYAELNLAYHAVFSVVIPVALVEMVFPGRAREPFLRRRGLVVTAVVALLGTGLLRVSVPPVEDPGYQAPAAALAAFAAAVALLGVAALRVLPHRRRRGGPAAGGEAAPPPRPPRPPRPRTVAVIGLVVTFAVLALLFPFAGARQPAFTEGAWALVPMAVAAVIMAAAFRTARRWTASPAWTGRSALAAASGALVAHTGFGAIAVADSAPDVVALTVAGVVMCLLLARLGRRLRAVPGGRADAVATSARRAPA